MIELQRKSIYVQQLEIAELKRKLKVIERNMIATTNASKNMQNEIFLVKEDRVVLELHNREIEQQRQELEQQLRAEIMMLRMSKNQSQKLISKLTAEHSRESKANKKYIKSLMSRN